MMTIMFTLAAIARAYCVLKDTHTSKDEFVFVLIVAARCVAPFIDIALAPYL